MAKKQDCVSKCAGCAFGRVVRHVEIGSHAEEGEGWKESREISESHCSHEEIAGRGCVVSFGTVLDCPAFTPRIELTLVDEVMDAVMTKVVNLGDADFGVQYAEYQTANTVAIMQAIRSVDAETEIDKMLDQAAAAVVQVVAKRRKEKSDAGPAAPAQA